MHLAFGGARPNRRPSHQIGNVLWRRRVKELTARRDAALRDIVQQPPRDPEAAVNIEAAIQTGIIDEPLPADRSARLLEINAHDDLQMSAELIANLFQPLRIVEGGSRIMHRTRPDNDDETIVMSLEDPMHGQAGSRDRVGS